MRAAMNVNEHIKQAESIFIGKNSFDDERVKFIENFDTCDLLAVPGSGKTTALIAKLYCIAQNMPFEDGSGVLILAHTNHAVEEIEKKLKKHCPQLFDYPNYVGTIQGFVNKFLANQACFEKFGSYIRQNDDELFCRLILNKIKAGKLNSFLRKLIRNNETIVDVIKEITYSDTGFCCDRFKNHTLSFSSDSGKALNSIFQDLRSNGYIKYKDSFKLAEYALDQHPNQKIILKNRFKYVFIDEMQDLEEYQIKIIDDIFYEENAKTVIQRIGDINQSIYGSGKKVKVECAWKPRFPRYLNNSHRLTKEVARLVNCFTLEPQIDSTGQPRFKVEGLRTLDNPIKPHLILFDQKTTGLKLQNKFEDLIKSFKLDNTESGQKNGFKIIGWNTVWDKDEQKLDKNGNVKIRLKDLFNDYSKESKAKKEHFDCLKKYLQLYDQEKKTFEAVHASILNALVQILRIEDISKSQNIPYRKSSLMDFIRNQGDDKYNDFKAKLFTWCFVLVVKKEFDVVYEEIKQFIETDFIKWNWSNETEAEPKNVLESKDFIDSSNYEFKKICTIDSKNEKKEANPYNIEINSVHAVKGQTHCATMYVETSYYEYETKKLKVICKHATKTKPEECLPYPLYLEDHSYRPSEDIRAKEALKMMYVGFSRPTHLLCFAALKDNIEDINPYNDAGWEIIDLTTSSAKTEVTHD
jgi:DNA helicase II / ATP-dependent DNA helicase PcrA